ncbi:hypothetical protein LU631_03710 [Erwinia tracheiphila]|uniref:Uncharacterized protein n=1 Tax=Erwinia tracheiphila TaxID=65700 RepID=A0A0M2KDW5_9GAMM|nr:hypothetical protein [Erwinia tracheiphila]EOS95377.1 hypothetical protein ETR_08621 [Erwinia tracheiphila PSU-1]KKF37134.1 hypothetical protein SY86_19740 [Erwinia tracheiphila]UIA88516.1 hypothetical protein LU631_03710 [Erwinia tracheiphila]UIA96894.1 hypothetical protein LU633_02385 [Erwinia tracheiphila]
MGHTDVSSQVDFYASEERFNLLIFMIKNHNAFIITASEENIYFFINLFNKPLNKDQKITNLIGSEKKRGVPGKRQKYTETFKRKKLKTAFKEDKDNLNNPKIKINKPCKNGHITLQPHRNVIATKKRLFLKKSATEIAKKRPERAYFRGVL